jgi:hypothetical protein
LSQLDPRRAYSVTAYPLGEQRRILGQRTTVEDGLVARGPGVDDPADILDRFGDRASISRASAFEHHMLNDMREPIEMLRFGARADHRVKAERHRFRARKRVDRDRQPIGQDMHFRGHGLGCSSFSLFLTASP